jgi:hypothetical protein
MKKLIVTPIIALMLLTGSTAIARNRPDEYLGLPGDNLNLYAVMKVFQESRTLEDFERNLNDQNSRINNLDLNGDNLIDYISVIDYPDRDVHNIVLQVALNRTEKQDVAVFTVQRFHNGSVQIQLIGDEALYGKNYIIEPIYADNSGETPNPGYVGTAGYATNSTVVTYTTFDIAAWPLISYIYLPGYIAWHSSWYWGFWPEYWHPWHPYYWDYYYGYHYNCFPDYYRHYHHSDYNRYHRYDDFYYSSRRSYSHEVNRRINEGDYRATYSHPEQRREGAALYAKTYPGQTSRREVSTSANNHEIKSFSQMNTDRRAAGKSSSSSAKSAPVVNNRRGTISQQTSKTNTISRPAANRSEKTTASRNTFRKSNATRSLTASTAGRTATDPSSAKISRTPRSSTSSFSQKAASRPAPSFNRVSSGSSRRSAPAVSSPAQRSSRASSSGTSVTSKSNSREAKADKSSTRR